MSRRQISAFSRSLPEVTPPAAPPTQAEPDPTVEFNSRLSRARERAAADAQTRIISARVPDFLARYADQFAGRSGLTKQEILAEALCLFAATHPLPPTPKDEEF